MYCFSDLLYFANKFIVIFFCPQGSGKTYTIGGGNTTTQTEDEFGIVPRAIKHMFAVMKVCNTLF